MKLKTLLPVLLLGAAPIWAVPCSGDITASLQSAVNAAVDGTTIAIGAGSCTINGIQWTNKNITIQGAGKGVTILTAPSGFDNTITNVLKASWRLTCFSMQSAASATPAI